MVASTSLLCGHITPLSRTFSPLTLTSRRIFSVPKFSVSRSRRFFSAAVMASAAKKVLVPVANGTEPMEAVITIDILRRAGADVTVASVEKQLKVDACHGVKIVADALVSDCSDTVFDLISLPGGMPGAATLRDCTTLESMVKKQAADGRLYAAICAAPAVALGSWGLLNRLKATCYPSFMEQLAASATAVESRVQRDGKVITSRGPGTAIEFSIALVEQLYGKEKADEVSVPLVMRPCHGDDYTITELNQMEWTYVGSPKILVPIANGTEEMEAVIIIDVLRRAKAEVVVASLEDKLEIEASRKVKLVADTLLDEAVTRSYDLIVLPGGLGGAEAFAKSEKLVNLLRKQRESNRPYGAVCASPALVLEPHGLLKGKKATAYPALCKKLSDQSEAENRVVADGNLITSRGPGTTMEFALAITQKLFGRNTALELGKTMLFGIIWLSLSAAMEFVYQRGELVKLVDTSLEGDFDVGQACKYLKVGLVCTQLIAKIQPSTEVKMQKGEVDVDEEKISKTGVGSELMEQKIQKYNAPCTGSGSGKKDNFSLSINTSMSYALCDMTFTSTYDLMY